jgi:hypothetical protein
MQEEEGENLMSLFDRITDLAYLAPCNDAVNLTFIAYVSKACGGSQEQKKIQY